jgi:hypothetical protein
MINCLLRGTQKEITVQSLNEISLKILQQNQAIQKSKTINTNPTLLALISSR